MSLLATLLATFCLCGGGGATATGKAVRMNPPPPPPPTTVPVLFTNQAVNGHCVGAEFLLTQYSPGWNVSRMSGIIYRESRCDWTVARSDSGSTGWLQILASHCPWLARQMGEPCTQARLKDPVYNVRAGAVLWIEQGYGAWSTS